MKTCMLLLLLMGLTACGTVQPQYPQYPPSSTNLYTITPSLSQPLQVVGGSGLPYASEGAAVAFAVLSLIMAIKNRQLKKQAGPPEQK